MFKLYPKVLLIDDEPAHLLLLEHTLKSLNFSVVTATSFQEAKLSLLQEEFALVLSDLHLQDLAKEELVHQLTTLTHRPIVMLTASSAISDAVLALQQGASDFISKTFDADFNKRVFLSLKRALRLGEIEEERRKLASAIEAFRVSIEMGSDALAVLGPENRLLYFNPSFARLLSYLQFSPTITHLGDDFLDLTQKNGEVRKMIAGESRELSFSLDTYQGKGTNFRVLWIKDVTELRRRERFQRELIATTTHDLRGPLSSTMMLAEILVESNKEGPVLEIGERIQASAMKALKFIDVFLSARQLEEGLLQIERQEFQLDELLNQVALEYQPIGNARKIVISVIVTPNLKITSDKICLSRILGNLVENALKFSPDHGKILLYADLKEVVIIDEGKGVPKEEREKIFQKAHRLEEHKSISGYGLGLYVVLQLISALNGSILVEDGAEWFKYLGAEKAIPSNLGSAFRIKLMA
jgi:signal transduction histidine kinase